MEPLSSAAPVTVNVDTIRRATRRACQQWSWRSASAATEPEFERLIAGFIIDLQNAQATGRGRW